MDEEFDLDQYVALMAETLGIPVSREDRPGVVLQMRRTADLANHMMEFDAPPELESAQIFKA
jgi:hypothetical protein